MYKWFSQLQTITNIYLSGIFQLQTMIARCVTNLPCFTASTHHAITGLASWTWCCEASSVHETDQKHRAGPELWPGTVDHRGKYHPIWDSEPWSDDVSWQRFKWKMTDRFNLIRPISLGCFFFETFRPSFYQSKIGSYLFWRRQWSLSSTRRGMETSGIPARNDLKMTQNISTPVNFWRQTHRLCKTIR